MILRLLILVNIVDTYYSDCKEYREFVIVYHITMLSLDFFSTYLVIYNISSDIFLSTG